MAGPSSSTSEITRDHSFSPGWKYEVFLSFYGQDTRTSFTDHLYNDLKRKGILVFRDDEALPRGEYISQALLKAIQDSQYAMVVFSANYAFSKWCLMELAKLVEWEEKKKLIILPIFYHVDPSNVRNHSGSFAEAFTAHEKDPKIDKKDMDTWRNALRKAGSIAGWRMDHDRYESTIIQKVCGRISNELNSRYSRHDYDKLVAINSRVEEMLNLMDMESNDVRFIGIHGMGGVGKTTLAEIIYDRVSCQFEGSSFIPCIRENSTTARDLASLQKDLLYMIMQEEIRVCNHRHGSEVISRRLRDKKVFIVIDDVVSEKQLMALAGDRKWFGPGSRVIITCRDSHLLETHGVLNDMIYKVEQLQTDEALQLFSLSAFKKTYPTENYKDLSMDFVNYAQGLPLALKVLGSFLFGRQIDAWKSARDQLKAIPNPEIMDVLQISFDGLKGYSQKELFLDMACFFRGQDIFSGMLLERFGHYRIDLYVLVEKSLISKSKYGSLSMHDLLKELGREIVRRECPEEPGRRSRLHRLEDFYHVLKNDTGTDAIKAIVVDFWPETKVQRLNAKALSKMRKLRYFEIHHSRTLNWRGDPLKYMPINELRYLEWPGYHLKSFPSSFQPKNLTVLRMSESRIKQLWKGLMVLDNLKEFDLSYSKNLIETPDLTGAPNLGEINLKGCTSLCELHPSIGSLKKLKSLVLDLCSSLEKLPDLSCLECLTHLWASETAITQIPSVNLRPKSIGDVLFVSDGSKLMRLKSRDPIYDIGSFVEYQKEGTYDHVEAKWIDYDSEGKNILDMAGVVISALYDDLNVISGWSLGFHIPEWVQYKSNGYSVQIDLDANRNPEMGFAFFIICDSDQFFSTYQFCDSKLLKILSLIPSKKEEERLSLNGTLVMLTIVFEADEEYHVDFYYKIPPPLNGSFGKQIGFWVYIPAVLRFFDIRRVIKISFETRWHPSYNGVDVDFEEKVEVKECGVHLVCPDDANSNFFNSIAPCGRSGSSNSDFHRHFDASMMKQDGNES